MLRNPNKRVACRKKRSCPGRDERIRRAKVSRRMSAGGRRRLGEFPIRRLRETVSGCVHQSSRVAELFGCCCLLRARVNSSCAREIASSTIFSNMGIRESAGMGCCKSMKLWSQRCDMSRFAEDSLASSFVSHVSQPDHDAQVVGDHIDDRRMRPQSTWPEARSAPTKSSTAAKHAKPEGNPKAFLFPGDTQIPGKQQQEEHQSALNHAHATLDGQIPPALTGPSCDGQRLAAATTPATSSITNPAHLKSTVPRSFKV